MPPISRTRKSAPFSVGKSMSMLFIIAPEMKADEHDTAATRTRAQLPSQYSPGSKHQILPNRRRRPSRGLMCRE